MNDASEHDIDRVLTALRDTQPAEGLEIRILRAIEQRTPAQSAWFRWTQPMQWRMAVLATAAVVLAVALTHTTRHNDSNSVASAGAQASPSVTSVAVSPTPVISTGASWLHATRSGEIAAFTEAGATQTPTHLATTPPTPHQLLCDCDPVAMAEMEAPSRPAPVMPLTSQERLLQRVVRQNDSFELAELELPQHASFRPIVPAREDDAVKNVVQHFLKQLAAAETINPTAPVPEPTDPRRDTDLNAPN